MRYNYLPIGRILFPGFEKETCNLIQSSIQAKREEKYLQ